MLSQTAITKRIISRLLHKRNVPAIARFDGSYKVDAGFAFVSFRVLSNGEVVSALFDKSRAVDVDCAQNLGGLVSLLNKLEALTATPSFMH